MKRIRFLLCLGTLLPAAGCGPELVGGAMGEVRAEATSSGSDTQASRSAAPSGARFSAQPLAASLIRGTVEFTASVVLTGESGQPFPITGLVTQAVRIEGSDTVFLGEQRVAAQSYTRARITFTRVAANVQSGLDLGGGALTGEVRVPIGGGESVVVEAPVALHVTEGGEGVLVVDLNAAAWLARADPTTREVSAADFRSAVRVHTR